MAIEKTVILKADTKGAVKGVNDLEKSIDGVNKEIKETASRNLRGFLLSRAAVAEGN